MRVGARWIVERAAAARDAGLDCLLVGDHHADPVPYYQNTPLLGRLLAEWGGGPFGALFLLPALEPRPRRRAGRDAGVAGRGRFILPLAVGGRDQFAPMGVQCATAEAVRGRSRDRPPAARGRDRDHWRAVSVQDCRISPVPTEPVEVWIGGTAERAVDRAARLGDGFSPTPTSRRSKPGRRSSCTGSDARPTGARRRRSPSAETSTWAPTPPTPIAWPALSSPPATEASTRRRARTGDAARVTEQLGAYAAMGYTDVIVRHLAEDQSEVLESFARLARVRKRCWRPGGAAARRPERGIHDREHAGLALRFDREPGLKLGHEERKHDRLQADGDLGRVDVGLISLAPEHRRGPRQSGRERDE